MIKSISVFFPAYNEEGNIKKTVEKAKAVLDKINIDYEMIVVNDGSKDNTGKIIDEIAKSDSRFRAIHHLTNQGYGSAVWTGITNCKNDIIFFTDGDGQFDFSEITNFIKEIEDYDVVIGYRKDRKDHFMRKLNAFGWRILNRIFFGLKVKDIDCAFKMFRRYVFDEIYVKSRGAMISAEMLIRIVRAGYKIKELPVKHLPRELGSPTGAKLSVILRAFKEFFKLYFSDFRKLPYKNKK